MEDITFSTKDVNKLQEYHGIDEQWNHGFGFSPQTYNGCKASSHYSTIIDRVEYDKILKSLINGNYDILKKFPVPYCSLIKDALYFMDSNSDSLCKYLVSELGYIWHPKIVTYMFKEEGNDIDKLKAIVTILGADYTFTLALKTKNYELVRSVFSDAKFAHNGDYNDQILRYGDIDAIAHELPIGSEIEQEKIRDIILVKWQPKHTLEKIKFLYENYKIPMIHVTHTLTLPANYKMKNYNDELLRAYFTENLEVFKYILSLNRHNLNELDFAKKIIARDDIEALKLLNNAGFDISSNLLLSYAKCWNRPKTIKYINQLAI